MRLFDQFETGDRIITPYGREALVVSAGAGYVIAKYPGTNVAPQMFPSCACIRQGGSEP